VAVCRIGNIPSLKLKTMKTLSSKLLIISALSLPVLIGLTGVLAGQQPGFVALKENSFLEKMASLFSRSNALATERVYVQTDKPLYAPGETIWFQAYVINTTDIKPSENSDIVHIQLINPKGGIEQEMKIIADNGSAGGDFNLGNTVPGGIYRLKAFTQWQNNEKEVLLFEKELQVQQVVLPRLKMKMDFERKAYGPGDEVKAKAEFATLDNKPLAKTEIRWIFNLDGQKFSDGTGKTDAEGKVNVKLKLPADLKTTDGLLGLLIDHEGNTESITRSVPIVLNKISLNFFPEGGDMVANLNSRVAFRALNEFNKPADIEGILMDDLDNKISSFSSYHSGMGSFELSPVPGRQYYVKITRPEGINDKYPVPAALIAGFTMRMEPVQHNSDMTIEINSTLKGELSLIGTVRDKIYFQGAFDAVPGKNKINIPMLKFPAGVARFTLFDSRGIPQAERLVFANKQKQMKISITTNKQKYQPREKVDMTLKTTDEMGNPVAANLSLAVTDDKLLSFADDRSGTILSRLYLEPELKEKVEEASFYFDAKEAKADTALDYLLLTSGWRHFTWQQVTGGEKREQTYAAEKAVIGGVITDMETGKPLEHKKIELTSSSLKLFTYTDNTGAYHFKLKEMTEPVNISVTDPQYIYYATTVAEFNSGLNLSLESVAHRKIHEHVEMYLKRKSVQREMMMKPQFDMVEKMEVQKNNPGIVYEWNTDKIGGYSLNGTLTMNPGPDLHPEPKIEKDDNIIAIRGNMTDSTIEYRGVPIAHNYYYKARTFPVPDYSSGQKTAGRSDFRSTIYWQGGIETGADGTAEISFYNSDEITAFRATVEGIGNGLAGHEETVFYTQLPFSISAKIPNGAAAGDHVQIPVNLTNNTNEIISGNLSVIRPASWQATSSSMSYDILSSSVHAEIINPKSTKTILLDYDILNRAGQDTLRISFNSSGHHDEIAQAVTTSERGFPEELSFSGQDKDKTYSFDIGNPVSGTLHAGIDAYPSSLSETMKGLESILAEPYGCFEQTSSSNYPNIIALMYMKETGETNEGIKSRALDLLDRGYKRLISFETPQKGYEWFGSAPANEALTAYGLMEFNDMKDVYKNTDQTMIDRTANWLMKRKDNSGGFMRDSKAIDQFGRASQEVTNAYIVYALSEAGYKNIKTELDASVKRAEKSGDAYELGLVANALYDMDDVRAEKITKKLSGLQKADGSWEGSQTITMSGGKELKVETTSLAIMALMRDKQSDYKALENGVKFIIASRNGSGGFGSTQTTVLALKALTRFSKFSKHTREAGKIIVYIDDKQVSEQKYGAGQREEIKISGLESSLTPGKHTLRVQYQGTKYPLPYSVSVKWRNTAPANDEECPVKLSTTLSANAIKTGETVRLTAVIKNSTHNGQPSTVAILGIPAGLSAQPWQLKELQEKGIYDYYEISGNKLILYYREMKPDEIKNINLDLKAEIPGSYEAPASCAYLYYTSEYKSWCKAGSIVVRY
jgi:alpha-2-macroglobulin-like protein